MARPTKYSAKMQENLCNWIHKGCTFKDACVMERISFQTFNEWRKTKPEFSESIKRAEAEAKAERIKVILKASEEHWQAAAWWLERRYPEEYSLKASLRVIEEQAPDLFDLWLQKMVEDSILETGGKKALEAAMAS